MNTTWLALTVVGVIAMLSAGLGLMLYRFSGVMVRQRSVRLTGATAIAWIFFLSMARLYGNVSQDLWRQEIANTRAARDAWLSTAKEVTEYAGGYKDCALQVGEFQCKAPADRLLTSCELLLSQLKR